ncbi:MAG TPA: addiction module protein [Pyrinomonadaceae bacterium]|nr:addiction module protein [Pyrinomonadaceae bacterium]
MSQPVPLPPPGFDALSIEEQIDYVQSLWDHIAARPEQVAVPDWHLEILNERVKEYQTAQGKSWEEVERDIKSELNHPPGE